MWLQILRNRYMEEAGEGEGGSTGDGGEGGAGEGTPPAGEGGNAEAGKEPEGGEGGNAGAKEGAEGSSEGAADYADFTMPEGVKLDPSALEKFAPIMGKAELSQEHAQELVTEFASYVQAQEQAQADNFTQQTEQWANDAKEDKEIGGDSWDESVSTAHSAIEAFGTPELKELMEDFGVGNHPEMIRFMVKVGNAIKEDSPGSGKNLSGKQDRASILYPKD